MYVRVNLVAGPDFEWPCLAKFTLDFREFTLTVSSSLLHQVLSNHYGTKPNCLKLHCYGCPGVAPTILVALLLRTLTSHENFSTLTKSTIMEDLYIWKMHFVNRG